MSETTSTVTPVEFVRARLDEDEQVALDAACANPGSAAKHWSAERIDHRADTGVWGKAWAIVPERVKGVMLAVSPAEILPKVVTHIARHDPARVLAEVEAKRQIIELHGIVHTLRLLALPYASHPDYDEEWRL